MRKETWESGEWQDLEILRLKKGSRKVKAGRNSIERSLLLANSPRTPRTSGSVALVITMESTGGQFRKVKIIATIGRSSCQKSVLKDMIAAGMDAARITDRFVDPPLEDVLRTIREAATEMGAHVGIMLSLRESDVRIGCGLQGSQIFLQEGEVVRIAYQSDPITSDQKVLKCNNKDFLKTVEVGDLLLVDFGKIIMTVEDIEDHVESSTSTPTPITSKGSDPSLFPLPRLNRSSTFSGVTDLTHQERRKRPEKIHEQKKAKVLVCKVRRKCTFTLEKPVTIERDGQTILTTSEEKEMVDIKALQWANEHDIDSVVYKQIFEQEALEAMLDIHVHKAKHFVGIQYDYMLDQVGALLRLVDGLVVCRGSLGLSSSYPDVCRIQKQLIGQCRDMGKISIVSTQLLDSMLRARAPSSADITDLMESVLDGCDAVLLVGASAYGDYPVEAIRTCSRIITEAENFSNLSELRPKPEASTLDIISFCAVTCAARVNAIVIICITHKTDTARILSRQFPHCPVVALTDSIKTFRHLRTIRGIFPVLNEGPQRGGLYSTAVQAAMKHGFAKAGDTVVYLAGEDDAKVTGDTYRFQINIV